MDMDRDEAIEKMHGHFRGERNDTNSCYRCNNEAKHKMALAADNENPIVGWRKLCGDCLRELGKWWREEL